MDNNIIFLNSGNSSHLNTPEIIKTSFEIFYAEYLDKPGREKLFKALGKIGMGVSGNTNLLHIEPLVKSFVMDCYTAGKNLFKDVAFSYLTTIPRFIYDSDAFCYLSDIWIHLPVILSSCLNRVSTKLNYSKRREGVRNAVYDFLFEISRQAYYTAAMDMYKRITA